jgi:hypothetical protein
VEEDGIAMNVEGSSHQRDDLQELERTVIEETSQYYKLANPMYPQELDWAITFSKFNFPWPEIAFK